MTANWLRWWDRSDNPLSWSKELTEQLKTELEQERNSRELLAAKLRELGIDPTQLS